METEAPTQGSTISQPQISQRSANARAVFATTVGIGAGFALALGIGYWQLKNNYPGLLRGWIPQVSNVASGFVIPSKLEIKVRDVDGEGHVETYAIYKGKKYFFKEDSSGRPMAEDYFK